MSDLALSDGERAIAEHFKSKYGLRWPFAAHLAKDAIGICELSALKSGTPDSGAAMDDVVERLKYYSGWNVRNTIPDDPMTSHHHLLWDAIDEIERLRAETSRLGSLLDWADQEF